MVLSTKSLERPKRVKESLTERLERPETIFSSPESMERPQQALSHSKDLGDP